MSAPKRCDSQSGQVLPLALTALLCAALLLAFCFRATERLVQRERVRARADATAFSGGVSYARGLNILAASQKAVALGWVLAIFDGATTKDQVQRLQKFFLLGAPWLSETVTLDAGRQNGLWSVPVWNQATLFDGLEAGDFLPSYNVAPYTLADAAAKAAAQAKDAALKRLPAPELLGDEIDRRAKDLQDRYGDKVLDEAAGQLQRQLPGWEPDGLYRTRRYEYRRRDGSTVVLKPDEAGPVWERGPGGRRVRRYKAGAAHKYRYVKRIPSLDTGFQLSLDEGDPHMLTLAALQTASADSGEARPGLVLALSQVQVAGGSLSLGDPAGSIYGPTLVPVSLFPEAWTLRGAAALSLAMLRDQGPDGDPKNGPAARLRPEEALALARGLLASLPLPAAALQRANQGLDFAGELDRVQH